MGLTIHYSLSSKTRSADRAKALVEQMRQLALDLPFDSVDAQVQHLGPDVCQRPLDDLRSDQALFSTVLDASQHVAVPWHRKQQAHVSVQPLEVFSFWTVPGPGSEWIVDESRVRAKRDYTRVFVPLTPEVLAFYNDLGKWFLHFSEPDALTKAILPKANRNLGDRKAAVIYRRGVRVREFESSDTESLFDYNLNDLTIDEARKASDWDMRHHCGRALAGADRQTLAILFDHLLNSERPAWEWSFDVYALQQWDGAEAEERKRLNWQEAFAEVAGETAVLTGEGTVDQLERKGYKPVKAPEGRVNAAARYGVRTPAKVLSQDELSGRHVTDPTDSAQAAVDFVWRVVHRHGLDNGKEKPPVRCFTSILDAGTMLNGYYHDGVVYINADLAPWGVTEVPHLSNQLLKVALEELAHYVVASLVAEIDYPKFKQAVHFDLGRDNTYVVMLGPNDLQVAKLLKS